MKYPKKRLQLDELVVAIFFSVAPMVGVALIVLDWGCQIPP